MPLDEALKLALEKFRHSNPFVQAAKSGCQFEGSHFLVPFFNRTYKLSYPEGEILGHLPSWLRLLFLHYLTNASGVPLSGQWISYRYLPGAQLFEARFQNLVLNPFIQAFGKKPQGFKKASLSLGALELRMGDIAFRFMAFPKFPIAVVLYLGDEELPHQANFLFDASAPDYLSTEEVAYLGGYLVKSLKVLA